MQPVIVKESAKYSMFQIFFSFLYLVLSLQYPGKGSDLPSSKIEIENKTYISLSKKQFTSMFIEALSRLFKITLVI